MTSRNHAWRVGALGSECDLIAPSYMRDNTRSLEGVDCLRCLQRIRKRHAKRVAESLAVIGRADKRIAARGDGDE